VIKRGLGGIKLRLKQNHRLKGWNFMLAACREGWLSSTSYSAGEKEEEEYIDYFCYNAREGRGKMQLLAESQGLTISKCKADLYIS
jgi:hypothetical protein